MFGRNVLYWTRNPSVLGVWKHGSLHSKVTHVAGVKHESIICETVIKNNATQSNNALTSKENCFIFYKTVTEVTRLSETLAKTGVNKPQHVAWKDYSPKVTKAEVDSNFDIRRKTTDEEDKNFQATKNLSNTNYSFRNHNIRATDRYTNSDTNSNTDQ
jgi:hypothetical protein